MMNLRCSLLVILLFPMAPMVVQGDTQDDLFAKLPPGESVIGETWPAGFHLSGNSGTKEIAGTAGQPFSTILRIVTQQRPESSYQFQISAPNIAPVKKDDLLLAIFYARAADPIPAVGEAFNEFVFEQATDPYEKSISRPMRLTAEWQKFYIPFAAKSDFAPSSAQINFRAGFDPQTIEIGGFQLINYKQAVAKSAMPWTPNSYRGREADAPWRITAGQRIEQFRKAPLHVTVRDKKGRPVPDAKVSVEMKRHAFGFGSAVDARMLLEPGENGEKYREIVSRHFNKVVFENDLKWESWERDKETPRKAERWLAERSIALRGHCLLWPGKTNLPKSAASLFDEPGSLWAKIISHITEEVGAMKGACVDWDVLNEPFTNTDVQRLLGEEIFVAAFHAAHTADPKALLYINDYSILESGGKDASHQDHFEKTIRHLLSEGAPLQGIGIQGHFSDDLTDIPRLLEILDRFAKFNLPIQITELDVNLSDEMLQADYTRDLMTALFSHPAVNGILTWGFWEERHWIPNAAHYRKDWSLRPAGLAWHDLVSKQWWTKAEGPTKSDGSFDTRGFLGDYQVTATLGKVQIVKEAQLTPDGTKLEIRMP